MNKTRRKQVVAVVAALVLAGVAAAALSGEGSAGEEKGGEAREMKGRERVRLPAPVLDGAVSLEQALSMRRSVRDFRDEPLTLGEVGQMVWAAQGMTREGRSRTAPSAGATYPLEVYAVAGNVDGLDDGVFLYDPKEHDLLLVTPGDRRKELKGAALNQAVVADGAVVIVVAARFERTTARYGQRGIRYVHMEEGHAGQNIYLTAAALGLGTVAVGAFHDDDVAKVLGLDEGVAPLCLYPVGRL